MTGLSTFTSLGHDAHTFFDNLCEGKCGIHPITRFNCDGSTKQTTHQARPPTARPPTARAAASPREEWPHLTHPIRRAGWGGWASGPAAAAPLHL